MFSLRAVELSAVGWWGVTAGANSKEERIGSGPITMILYVWNIISTHKYHIPLTFCSAVGWLGSSLATKYNFQSSASTSISTYCPRLEF